MKMFKSCFLTLSLVLFFYNYGKAQQTGAVRLNTVKLESYVFNFNKIDTEAIKNFVPNASAFEWLTNNIPLFECPDSTIEQIYYYRWWTFRKHLKQTPDGFVFTEFITPVNHAGKYNTVSSATGHHIYEGRWLRNSEYIKDYVSFWLYVDPKTPKPHFRAFSSWIDDAVYNFYLVNNDKGFVTKLLPELNKDYQQWEKDKGLPNQMFWQYDVRDAMEESISGGRKIMNMRPTINSYMYGNAIALKKMAAIAGNDSLKKEYEQKALNLKQLVQQNLWNDSSSFFEVKHPDGTFANVREELGFIPWYFNLPADKSNYARAWDQLLDSTGFKAKWGIMTAERRHPGYRTHGSGHGCEWDGAVWPFATTQTLKGLSNLLNNYKKKGNMNAGVFYDELRKYAWSHQMNGHLYLGEYLDGASGEWLKGDNPRSTFYNHSGFADLVISDLVGLKPRADNKIEVRPLIPEGKWDWFGLDNVPYHGHRISIFWDKTGKKYGIGKGFLIYVDGKQIYQSNKLQAVVTSIKGI
jgi:hypothetical protein